MTARPDYAPALGLRFLTPLYDTAIAAFTREGAWRPRGTETDQQTCNDGENQ